VGHFSHVPPPQDNIYDRALNGKSWRPSTLSGKSVRFLRFLVLAVLLPAICNASAGARPRYDRSHYYSSPHIRSGRSLFGSSGTTRVPRVPAYFGRGSRSSSYGSLERDSHGRIKRSTRAKDDFKRQQPCPSTGRSSGSCPSYVIDHVVPLKRHGADAPSNMQWQTIQDAKTKDKIE
jgi:5-methylcytosine-specific restriction endonuclease McrA